MALPLYIRPCRHIPAFKFHPPPLDQPLRIQIEGPLVSIKRLVPEAPWHVDMFNPTYPQPAAPAIARITYQALYGQEPVLDDGTDLVVRDESLGWVHHKK